MNMKDTLCRIMLHNHFAHLYVWKKVNHACRQAVLFLITNTIKKPGKNSVSEDNPPLSYDGQIFRKRQECLRQYCVEGNTEEFHNFLNMVKSDTVENTNLLDLVKALYRDSHLSFPELHDNDMFRSAILGGRSSIIHTLYTEFQQEPGYYDYLAAIKCQRFDMFVYLMSNIRSPCSTVHKHRLLNPILEYGTPEMLMWFVQNGFNWSPDANTKMLLYCDIKTIAWVTNYFKYSFPLSRKDSECVVRTGRIAILEWMFNVYPPDYFEDGSTLWRTAIKSGQTSTFLWLQKRFNLEVSNGNLYEDAYRIGLENGLVSDMDKFYEELKIPLSPDFATLLALDTANSFRTNKDILKWLINKGASIDDKFFIYASQDLDFELLEWLKSKIIYPNKIPDKCFSTMIKHWYFELNGLVGVKHPTRYINACLKRCGEKLEFKVDPLAILDWAISTKTVPLSKNSLKVAVRVGNIPLYEALQKMGCQWFHKRGLTALEYAYEVNHGDGRLNEMTKYLDTCCKKDTVSSLGFRVNVGSCSHCVEKECECWMRSDRGTHDMQSQSGDESVSDSY